MLRELASEISKWLIGDLDKRDIAFVVRGKDGKDETVIIIPDPIVRAFLRWMSMDNPDADLLKMAVDSVYDYAEHEQTFHIVSMGMEGQGSHSVPLGGAFGARVIYKKMFRAD